MVKLDAPTKTPQEIAKKWKLPLGKVAKQIEAGSKVEKEHTKSPKAAREVARDHLGERPDYYKKLDKMEKTKIEKLEEVSKKLLAKYVTKISKMPSFSREAPYYYKNERFGSLAISKMAGKGRVMATDNNDNHTGTRIMPLSGTRYKIMNETNKDNKSKLHKWKLVHKDKKEKIQDFDPRRMFSSHNRIQAHQRAQAVNEETEMELNKIEEAIQSLVQGNYNHMKETLNEALQDKVMESLEERKKIIASSYFGQSE